LKKDRREKKKIQTEIKRQLCKANAAYKDKIELQLNGEITRGMPGTTTVSGQTQATINGSVLSLSE